MNKRLGLLSIFGITALLLVMVGAITAMAAPSATHGPTHVNGTVTLNKAWYTTAAGGNSVIVTVTDADQNVSTLTVEDETLTNGGPLAQQLITVTVGTGERIVGTPTILTSSGNAVAACIPANADTNFSIAIFGDGTTGNLIVTQAATFTTGARTVCYSVNKVDTVLVTVKSGLDTTGLVGLVAKESAAALDGSGNPVDAVDTGIFKVKITLTEGASSSTAKTLKSGNGDQSLAAEYTDLAPVSGASLKITSTAAKVETQKPTFSVLLPADGFSTKSTTVNFSASISDAGGSGVDIGTISLVFDGGPNAATTITGNSGDAGVSFIVSNLNIAGEGSHSWYVTAKDVSGNSGRSDSDTATVGDQDQGLKRDLTDPKILSAKTGKFWDLSLSVPAEGSKSSSVVVVFNGDMDAGSVALDGSDFTVTGATVSAANIYPYTAPSTTTPILGRDRVYLTLSASLVVDAKPTVALASGQSVADLAGNTLNSGSTDATTIATDGIKPSLTLALNKTISNDTVVASVTSNEALDTNPATFTVKLYTDAGAAAATFAAAVPTGTNSWTFTLAKGSAADAKYCVRLEGNDGAGNTGSKGVKTAGCKTDPASILVTLDTTAPAPIFTVGTVNFTAAILDVEGTSPLISVNFGEKVTVTRANFDGTDVLAQGTQSTDKKTWLYQASGLTVGKTYKITVSATDEAGNPVSDVGKSFNTIAVKLPEFPLKPGQNLISFTGNPVNGAINAVFSDASVTAVVTYDSATAAFQTAVRGADGTLSGTLTTIDGKHAYFVKSSAFGSVKVEIAKLGFDAVPGVMAVKKGWNLLPVVSAEGAKPLAADKTCATAPTSCVTADGYLSTVKWVTAYAYDPIASAWIKIQPKTFANLEIGRGYWVYVSEDGTLVP